MACPTPPLIKLRNKGTREMPPMLLLSLIPSLNGIGLRMGYIWYLLCLLFFWEVNMPSVNPFQFSEKIFWSIKGLQAELFE